MRRYPGHDKAAGAGGEGELLQAPLPRVGDDVRIPPSDVVVSMVTNSDEDWSFGNGRAQFLTGELAPERSVA